MVTTSKPRVVARLTEQMVIVLTEEKRSVEYQIVSLTSDYQHNKIAAYKTATVVNTKTGESKEIKLWANQRYWVRE